MPLRFRFTWTAVVAAVVAPGLPASGLQTLADEQRPTRIVSMNMCTDDLLLRLADKEQIASVTWLSLNPRNSNVPQLAAQYPVNHGFAEEVMAYRPDLTLAGVFTTRTTVQILRRTGVRVVDFGVPATMEAVRTEIRDMAALIGNRARGEAMVRDMDARLSSMQAHAPPLRAIVLRPNGFTVGKGSLVDEIMRRAGLDNMAAHLDIPTYLQIPLETIALQKADVLILSGDTTGSPSLATEALHHPIVAALGRRLRLVSAPSRLWTCAGPAVVDAVQWLITATGDDARTPQP